MEMLTHLRNCNYDCCNMNVICYIKCIDKLQQYYAQCICINTADDQRERKITQYLYKHFFLLEQTIPINFTSSYARRTGDINKTNFYRVELHSVKIRDL